MSDERPTPHRRRPRGFTLTLDVTTVFLVLAVLVVLLVVLVVVVGIFKDSLDYTAAASVLCVLAGGVVSGAALAARNDRGDKDRGD